VTDNPGSRSVYFPLASNAHSLVAGAGVARVRSRLKMCSVLYERVLIEEGQLAIQAGPQGASQWRSAGPGGPAGDGRTWQSAIARGRAQHSSFSISFATESTPDVPSAGPFRQVLASAATISWNPTFMPFISELPPTCDWVTFCTADAPPPGITAISRKWKFKDSSSPVSDRLVPERFVRNQVVSNIADDLATGLGGRWAVSTDQLHSQVFRARFADDGRFRLSGFALPILVPEVAQID